MAGKKRAPNNSGTIWKRPDGRYGVALTYPYHDPETGRTRRKRTSTTKPDWDSAHRWLVDKKHNTLRGPATMTGEDPALSIHMREWLRDSVQPRVAPNTYAKRAYSANNHILPVLGHINLSELGARRIQALYSSLMRDGYSLATRREIHVTLRMALDQAVRWGLLSHNPCEFVDTPKAAPSETDEDKEEIRALTNEQACKLFNETKEERWHNYYVVAIRTGLRPGEVLGLRWSDLTLDTDPGSVRVRRTLDTHSAARFGPPKSKASKRTVALHWEATEAFRVQREMLEEEGLATESKSLVFPSSTGTPMSASNLRNRYFQPTLARVGLPKLTLHELRHSFASIALYEWRLPPEIVSAMMGHGSIRITVDLYGHLMPGAQESAILALRRLHRGPGSQEESSA